MVNEFTSEAAKEQRIIDLETQLKRSTEEVESLKTVAEQKANDERFRITHILVDEFGYAPESVKDLGLDVLRAMENTARKVATDRTVAKSAGIKKTSDSRNASGLSVGRYKGKDSAGHDIWADGDAY